MYLTGRINIPKDKVLDYTGWTVLCITSLLMRFALPLVDNIIHSDRFLLEYLVYGTLLSSAILWLIYKYNRDYFDGGGESRGSAVLSYFFGVIGLFVFGAAYYNLATAKTDSRNVQAFVIKKFESGRPGIPKVLVQLNDQEEQFHPNWPEWRRIQPNSTVVLNVGRGKLGYDYIFSFSTLSSAHKQDPKFDLP
jgi:hypothetical protein